MDIYQLNKLTVSNIFMSEHKSLQQILIYLIDNKLFSDAEIILNNTNKKYTYSSHDLQTIKWLNNNNMLKLNEKDILYMILNKMENEILYCRDFIDIDDFIKYTVNDINFLKFIINLFNITFLPPNIYKICNFKIVNELQKIDKNINIDMNFFCIYCDDESFKEMFKIDKYKEYLYNYSLFTHNKFELVKNIPVRPEINKNIFKSIYNSLLKNSLYDNIIYVHDKFPHLFDRNELKELFIDFVKNTNIIPSDFFIWFRNICLMKNKKTDIFNALCYSDNLYIINHFYSYIPDRYIVKASIYGYSSTVKYLCDKCQQDNEHLLINKSLIISHFYNKQSNFNVILPYCKNFDILNNILCVHINQNFMNNLDKINMFYKTLMYILDNDFAQHISTLILDDLLNYIFKVGYPKFFNEYIYKIFYTFNTDNVLASICKCDNIYTFDMIYHLIRHDIRLVTCSFAMSCFNNSISVSKYIYDNYDIDKFIIENILKDIISSGYITYYNLDIICWMSSTIDFDLRYEKHRLFKECCKFNIIDIVEWLTNKYNCYSYTTLYDIIVDYKILIDQITYDFNDEQECSICLSISDSITNCDHYFCKDCINRWYNKNITCPLCREEIKYIYVKPIQDIMVDDYKQDNFIER